MPRNAGDVTLRHRGFHPSFFGFRGMCGAAAYATERRRRHASTSRLPPHLIWVQGHVRGGCICHGTQAASRFDVAASTPRFGTLGDLWGGCICHGTQAASHFDVAASTPLKSLGSLWGGCICHGMPAASRFDVAASTSRFGSLGSLWGGCICHGMPAASCFDVAASTPWFMTWRLVIGLKTQVMTAN